MKQQHARKCFTPMVIKALTEVKRDKAQQALMCPVEKRDGTTKGRMVHNGKPTREWPNKEESSSGTIALDNLFLTMMIDAREVWWMCQMPS